MTGEKKSPWTTFAAVLGAVAALIAALVGVWTAVDKAKTSSTQASMSSTQPTTTSAGQTPHPGGDKPPVTPTTKPPAFAVLDVQLSVSPPARHFVRCGGKETQLFTFTGAIATNGAGEVRYRWTRSDGAAGPDDNGTIQFTEAGTKQLKQKTWQVGAPGVLKSSVSYKLEVTSPNPSARQLKRS